MTRKQAQTLARALESKFGGDAEFEAVDKQGHYRFAITSKKFDRMTHLRRQDAIWKIVDEILPRGAILDVTTILAFAPADLVAIKG